MPTRVRNLKKKNTAGGKVDDGREDRILKLDIYCKVNDKLMDIQNTDNCYYLEQTTNKCCNTGRKDPSEKPRLNFWEGGESSHER